MKKILILVLVFMLLLSISACGNSEETVPEDTVQPETPQAETKNEEPEESDADKTYIDLEEYSYEVEYFHIENTETGTSFDFPLSPSILKSSVENIISEEYSSFISHNTEDGVLRSLESIEDGNPEGVLNTIIFYDSEEWVLNDVLHIGMPYSELVSAWGEANEEEEGTSSEDKRKYTTYIYYYPLPSGDNYIVACWVYEGEDTISSWGVYRRNDIEMTLPLYIAENYCSIISYENTEPNSAGGVSFNCTFENLSSQTVKYVNFVLTPYNRVDDPAYEPLGENGTITCTATGPFYPGVATKFTWENVWYNSDIEYVVIDEIEMIYMNESQSPTYLKIKE